MLYKSFQGWKLSALGMGAMRLPVIDGDDSRIDETAAEQMVAYAMESGINYYDTAWGYHNGQSELIMGRLLRKYPRESYFLASKFPGYDLANMDKVEEIFEKQLEKWDLCVSDETKTGWANPPLRVFRTRQLWRDEAFFACIWGGYGIWADSVELP